MTVSKALRGHPDISDETVERVRVAAEAMGYSPNFFARNLSSRRSMMLGLVVPKIAHYFFGSLIEGVYDTAFANRYETILTVSQEDAGRERKHLQTLVSMRVDGIICSISEQTKDLSIFKWIRKRGVPLVFVDRRPEPALRGFNTVLVDDRGGAFNAIEHSIKVGYKKIACIGGGRHTNIGRNRFLGFEAAMKEHALPVNPDWVIEGGFGKHVGYDGLIHLFGKTDRPEFIFAMTYPIALGIYEAAKELGLSIPNDIDVICFGDSDVSRVISPPLSCVTQPSYELGSKSVELMLQTIAQPAATEEEHLLLPTELLIRGTCIGKSQSSLSDEDTIQGSLLPKSVLP